MRQLVPRMHRYKVLVQVFQIRNQNYFDGEWYQASNIPRFCISPISFCNNCPIDLHTCLQEKFCFFFQNAFQLAMLVLITTIKFGHLVQFIYFLNSLKYKRKTIFTLKHKENHGYCSNRKLSLKCCNSSRVSWILDFLKAQYN